MRAREAVVIGEADATNAFPSAPQRRGTSFRLDRRVS
jgi:hypothetical protein